MRMLSLFAVLAAVLAGCQSEKPQPPPAAPPPAVESLGDLALVPVSGEAPVDQAVRAAQEAVRALPDRADSWVRLAEAWVQKARNAQRERLYDRAEAAAKKALSLTPKHPRAQRVLALVLQNAHRFAEMHILAAEMTRDAPRNADAWGLLCDAALERGQYAEAERACQQMLELAPGLPAFSRAAWLRWMHGDVEGALELWQEAVRLAPARDPEPRAFCLSEIGHLEWNRGRLDAAAQAYEAALALKPDHGPSLFGRGRLAFARSDFPSAIKDFRASAAARPSEVTAYWLASTLRRSGAAAEANHLEATLASAGDFDDPRSTALFLATHRKDPERAIALARRDVEARGDVFAEDALGFALLRAGRPDEAAPHLERAVRLNTPDPLLSAHVALLEAARGRAPEARAAADKALTLNAWFDPELAIELVAVLSAYAPEKP